MEVGIENWGLATTENGAPVAYSVKTSDYPSGTTVYAVQPATYLEYDVEMDNPHKVTGLVDGAAWTAKNGIIDDRYAGQIGYEAFHLNQDIRSINLPNVGYVGESACAQCPNLTSVELPKGLEIGNGAFSGCESLTSVSIPNVS